jgi:hypothetical protein
VTEPRKATLVRRVEAIREYRDEQTETLEARKAEIIEKRREGTPAPSPADRQIACAPGRSRVIPCAGDTAPRILGVGRVARLVPSNNEFWDSDALRVEPNRSSPGWQGSPHEEVAGESGSRGACHGRSSGARMRRQALAAQ